MVTRDKSFSNLVPYQFVATYMRGLEPKCQSMKENRETPATDCTLIIMRQRREGKSNLNTVSTSLKKLLFL